MGQSSVAKQALSTQRENPHSKVVEMGATAGSAFELPVACTDSQLKKKKKKEKELAVRYYKYTYPIEVHCCLFGFGCCI